MFTFGVRTMSLVIVGVVLVLVPTIVASAQLNETVQYHHVCPKDFVNVGRKCYRFSNNTGTWFQAYFTCRDISDNFTIFTERIDQETLERFLFRNKGKGRAYSSNAYWVGGSKDWKRKKWIYTDGSLIQFPTAKEIANPREDDWTCLLIDAKAKKWRAENCMEKRPFICESKPLASVELKVVDKKVKRKITIDDCISNTEDLTKKQKKKCWKMLNGDKNRDLEEPAAVIQPAKATQPTFMRPISHICPQNWMSLGNQCYLFSKEKATWIDAHFNCGQINAKLAMIKSKAQDQKLRIFLNGFTEKQERWIGGRYNPRTRQWIWALNGKPLKYQGFDTEPITNTTGLMDFQAIVMDPVQGYRWSHRNEMQKHLYICQVKGRAVKRLNYPKRPQATIAILPEKRYLRRSQRRSSWRANRNKRT